MRNSFSRLLVIALAGLALVACSPKRDNGGVSYEARPSSPPIQKGEADSVSTKMDFGFALTTGEFVTSGESPWHLRVDGMEASLSHLSGKNEIAYSGPIEQTYDGFSGAFEAGGAHRVAKVEFRMVDDGYRVKKVENLDLAEDTLFRRASPGLDVPSAAD